MQNGINNIRLATERQHDNTFSTCQDNIQDLSRTNILISNKHGYFSASISILT